MTGSNTKDQRRSEDKGCMKRPWWWVIAAVAYA